VASSSRVSFYIWGLRILSRRRMVWVWLPGPEITYMDTYYLGTVMNSPASFAARPRVCVCALSLSLVSTVLYSDRRVLTSTIQLVSLL